MPEFELYTVEPVGIAIIPFIVTAAYTNPGGYPIAEWFLAIPDEKCSFFAQRLRFRVRSFPPGEIELTEQLMIREALEQAKLRLRQYLFETKEAKGSQAYFHSSDVVESNKDFFVHYWIRGQCAEHLEKIADATEHDPLRNFLMGVMSLPKIHCQDL